MGCRDIVDLQITRGEFPPQRIERVQDQSLMCLDDVEDGVIGIYAFKVFNDFNYRWFGSGEIEPSRCRQGVAPRRPETDYEAVI